MRKQKQMICVILAMLIAVSATGCRPAESPDIPETTQPTSVTEPTLADPIIPEDTIPTAETTLPTETTAPEETAATTEPATQPSTEPTEAPTEPKPATPTKPTEETKPAGGNDGGSGTVDQENCKHQFGNGVYTAPTCEEAGKLVSTCKICGLQRVSDYMATGHSYSAKIVAPTTEAQGYTLHTCRQCGNTYKDTYTDKLPAATTPAHTHSYSGVVTQKATCTKAGTKTYTCSCGDSYTEEIPVGDHAWKCVHHEAEGHYSDYYVVCRCGWSMKKSEMEATGYNFIQYYALFHVKGEREHSYTLDGTDWVEDAPAYDEWVCTECGKATTENPN